MLTQRLGGQCQELPLLLMNDHHRGQTPELPDQPTCAALGPAYTAPPLGYGEQPLTHLHTYLWKVSWQLALVWTV